MRVEIDDEQIHLSESNKLQDDTPQASSSCISSFDELKSILCENVENLRFLWEENRDALFSFNQVLCYRVINNCQTLCTVYLCFI